MKKFFLRIIELALEYSILGFVCILFGIVYVLEKFLEKILKLENPDNDEII